MITTNARSINSKIDELKATAIELNPDIIAITKTWTNAAITNSLLNIPGYKIITRKDRTDTKDGRGGGILAYIKSGITRHEIATPQDIIQVGAFQIKLAVQNLNIFIIYRSPNSSTENNDRLNDFIRSMPENSLAVALCKFPIGHGFTR